MDEIFKPDTIMDVLVNAKDRWINISAQTWRVPGGEFFHRSFGELYQEARTLAAGLKSLGIIPGSAVGLISDNRQEWLPMDLAILGLGACDVPRGRDTMAGELVYILGIPECSLVVAENQEQVEKILSVVEKLPQLKTIVVIDPDFNPRVLKNNPNLIHFVGYGQLGDLGKDIILKEPDFWESAISKVLPDQTATIIFTSGTTGLPKGVPLTHRNFWHQLKEVPKVIDIKPGEIWLSVLPVWHVLERIATYIALYTGSTLAYSKPIGKIMLQDFRDLKPQWMVSVPRIWEAIKAGVEKSATEKGGLSAVLFKFFVGIGGWYVDLMARFQGRFPHFKPFPRIFDKLGSVLPLIVLYPFQFLGNLLVFSKIRRHLGGRFKACVSGGGSLPLEVDRFFASVGIKILNGYGLTETAPVLAIRNYFHPVLYTLAPLPDTEIRIVDENQADCPPGKKGLILARGAQVMTAYYKNQEATKSVLDPQGWFNTGDLGMWTTDGNFVIRGRAKDTIVLSGGENVEPGPIEAKLRESPFIEQALVVGQDKKFLGVLIQPNALAVEQYFKDNNLAYIARSGITHLPETEELINEEIASRINGKNGFRPFERIVHFAMIEKPFEVGLELSAKQEVKRHTVTELYAPLIEGLFRIKP